MQSKVYEFSIKISKILTRHTELMHLDLTNVGLKKEEIYFIGMSITIAKALLSIHLSGN